MSSVSVAHRAVVALGDERAEPDLAWIQALTGASRAEVETVLAETDELVEIENGIRHRHRQGGRDSYAQFRAPFDLYAMVRLLRPIHVVETGVSSGISSAHFLLGLRTNGRGTLHSIDLPIPQRGPRLAESESAVALPPGRTSGWAMPEELRPGWDLHLGPAQVLLPVVTQGIDRVDLFLHDSHHTPEHLMFELETVRAKLTPGAIVLADNVEWTGDSFDRFAASLKVPVHARGGEDLVGLRVPPAPAPAGSARAAASKSAPTKRRRPRAARG
jgi:predicted O-methyltransferase YrrM